MAKPDGTNVQGYTVTAEGRPPVNVTAAARVLSPADRTVRRTGGTRDTNVSTDQTWQQEIWDLYDEVGQLHFVLNWVARNLSQVRLYAARPVPMGEPEAVEEGHPAAELVADFAGGPLGQGELMARGGLQVGAVGETMLVGRGERGDDEWHAASNIELTRRNRGRWQLDTGNGYESLGSKDIVTRAWNPHARRWWQADAPTRAAIPYIREARSMTQYVQAQADSRVATAGMILLPNGVSIPVPPGVDTQGMDPDTWVEQWLMETMVTGIQQPDSAARFVPLMLRGPGEEMDRIRYIRFAEAIDPEARLQRDDAVKNMSVTLGMPPEIVLGLGSTTNHWNAWKIESDAVKLAVAPMAATMCHALTVGWLRPALESAGVADPDGYLLWYDVSPLELRGDRSTAAVEVYDRGELSGEALRRENGFDEGDAPDGAPGRPDASGSEQTSTPVAVPAPRANPDTEPEGRGTPDRPEGTAPEGEPPAPVTAAATPDCGWSPAALMAAADVAVFRALELVGKRLDTPRSRHHEIAHVPHEQVHVYRPYDKDPDKLLADAWKPLENALPGDVYDCAQPALDRYVRRLLNTRTPHTRADLETVLADADCGCDG